MLVDGALLDGVPANITWYADDGEPPKPMFCRLRRPKWLVQFVRIILTTIFLTLRFRRTRRVAFDRTAQNSDQPEDMCAPVAS